MNSRVVNIRIHLCKLLSMLFFGLAFSTASVGQNKKDYSKEVHDILQFVRTNMFEVSDSVRFPKLLSNRKLFSGFVIFSLRRSKIQFDEAEINLILDHIKNDSLILDAGNYQTTEDLRLPADSMRTIGISIPIFLKNYSYCILSYNVPFRDEEYTELFGKKDGQWSLVARLGGIVNY